MLFFSLFLASICRDNTTCELRSLQIIYFCSTVHDFDSDRPKELMVLFNSNKRFKILKTGHAVRTW